MSQLLLSRPEAARGPEHVRAVYQPVLDLERNQVVGYEARMRDAIWSSAFDWRGLAAALGGALHAGMRPPATLFFDAEPETLGSDPPDDLRILLRRAQADLDCVVTVSWRRLVEAPDEMLAQLETARERGWGVAVDDIGDDWCLLALLTLVRPDVVKIDRQLVHEPLTRETTRIARVLQAHARESGARLLAQGIDTPDNLARARALGAQLGQGAHLGAPTALPVEASRRRCVTRNVGRVEDPVQSGRFRRRSR